MSNPTKLIDRERLCVPYTPPVRRFSLPTTRVYFFFPDDSFCFAVYKGRKDKSGESVCMRVMVCVFVFANRTDSMKSIGRWEKENRENLRPKTYFVKDFNDRGEKESEEEVESD